MNFRNRWVRSKLKGGALHNVPSNMGASPAGLTVRRSTRDSRSGSNAMPLHGQAGALIRIWHECYLLRALSSLTWDYIDPDLRSRSRRSVFSARVKHTCAQFQIMGFSWFLTTLAVVLSIGLGSLLYKWLLSILFRVKQIIRDLALSYKTVVLFEQIPQWYGIKWVTV